MGSVRSVDLPQRDIRFTTTDDGVGIAYWEIGSGTPIVIVNNWAISHAELEWAIPALASFYIEMTERYRVVRFDPRGTGMSDDPPGGWGVTTPTGAQQGMTTHDMGLDISAVTAASKLDTFVLMAVGVQGPVCIEYAATHSDAVIGLILCDSVAKHESSWQGAGLRMQQVVFNAEDELGEELPFSMWDRGLLADEADQWAAITQQLRARAPGPEAILAQMEWNGESLLGAVVAPTLVLHTRNAEREKERLSETRKLTAEIPGAQLRIIDGDSMPYLADRAAVPEAIDELLQPEHRRPRTGTSFTTVVFTDIVGSTQFVRQVGDEQGRTGMRLLEQQVAELAVGQGGRVVKNLGDGSLISFGPNTAALTFALELQTLIGDGPLQLRVGMAAGEPIQEDGDIHGAVVVQASRIADLAEAGEVIVSEGVHQLAVGKGFVFEEAGEVTLKGFDQPTTVWKVGQ